MLIKHPFVQNTRVVFIRHFLSAVWMFDTGRVHQVSAVSMLMYVVIVYVFGLVVGIFIPNLHSSRIRNRST